MSPANAKHRGCPGRTASDGPAKDLPQSYAENTVDTAIENATADWWSIGAGLAIDQLARSGRGFTIDHVLELTGEPTDPHYPGAVMAAAQRRRVIEAVGAVVGRGGRLLRVWWGVPE